MPDGSLVRGVPARVDTAAEWKGVCPHERVRFDRFDCIAGTKRPTTNRAGCCRHHCASPLRMCHRCLDERREYTPETRVVDAEHGLCAMHLAKRASPADGVLDEILSI